MIQVSSTRMILASALVALVALTGCPKGKLPGGLPDKPNVPGSDKVPGGLGGSSDVDPNSCGNYAVSDAGAKLKAFLTATKQLQEITGETAKVVKQSCILMGNELGMTEADYTGETKDICAKVWGVIDANMKVVIKSKAALKVKYKPAVCKVNVDVQAKAAAQCEGKASADVGATCSGTCRGKCEGTCAGKAGTGGNAGSCDGECKGTCRGECEGHADVKASAQCKANASIQASADMQCTEPDLDISFDAKLVVDKTKAEATLKALKAGLPKLLSVKARLAPIKYAAEAWVVAAKELKDAGPKLANSFKDQALCISGQIAAVASAIANIQVNVSVSVEVSAQASGSVGGGA